MKLQHSAYMDIALEEARKALVLDEVPVGCVIVHNGTIVASAHNLRETDRTALGHAEIYAIAQACRRLNSWRLDGCTIYVTLEPCPMCMGAILNARISKVVFGAYDLNSGCCGSVIDFNSVGFNHRTEILSGIREFECVNLLKKFFSSLRQFP